MGANWKSRVCPHAATALIPSLTIRCWLVPRNGRNLVAIMTCLPSIKLLTSKSQSFSQSVTSQTSIKFLLPGHSQPLHRRQIRDFNVTVIQSVSHFPYVNQIPDFQITVIQSVTLPTSITFLTSRSQSFNQTVPSPTSVKFLTSRSQSFRQSPYRRQSNP